MPDKIQLPLVAQELDYSCGAACFESMFRHFRGTAPGELHFAKELGTLDLGYTDPPRIVQLARDYGFQATLKSQASIDELSEALANSEVAFVTWWDGEAPHYSLVMSVDSDAVILMDPWTAREGQENRVPLDLFIEYWKMREARLIRVSEVRK